MTLTDYAKAYGLGKKDYQYRMLHGMQPTLEVLDDILPGRGAYSEVPLGLVQIPTDQIVGTKTGGRSSAFAGNFMPILRESTEFAQKWQQLSDSHVTEGIREPVKAYEYMNKFYVLEGNKRVSVMKFYGATAVPGIVTRIVPKRTQEKENKIYYEFMEFYDLSKVNYIWFSEEGSFRKLQELVGKQPQEVWTDEDKLTFSSIYRRFCAEYKRLGEEGVLPGDAFLAFLSLYGYEDICDKTTKELKAMILNMREEFGLLEKEESVDLKLSPNEEKRPLLNLLLPTGMSRLKIAFVYAKTAGTSAWTYAHELGRLHLEQAFPDKVTTIYYDAVTDENIKEVLCRAVEEGCDIIFTTSPAFVQESVKAAIANPQLRILNCSLHTSHRYIRTYYARMHEAKFVMGAVAGALAGGDRIAYIADLPVYGSIANINAFALGAKMINPRAQVYLEWSSMKDQDVYEKIGRIHADCISGKDMVIPEESSRYFGIYCLEDGMPRSLAMPLWHWGKFYERLIRTMLDKTWKYDEKTSDNKAINYWWGMSSDVIDVVCSQSLPIGTRRLVDLLKATISRGEFNPFSGILYSQTGVVQEDPGVSLTPEQIVKMDWLAENVVGRIPMESELEEEARSAVAQQGVNRKG